VSETERFMAHKPEDISITPQYMDDDMLLIDNVKLLGVTDPVYMNMNFIVFCRKGMCKLEVNGEMVEIRANQVFICPPGASLNNVLISPDFEYQAFAITSRMLQSVLGGYMKVWNQFTYVDKLRIVEIGEKEMEFYEKIYETLKLCMAAKLKDDTDVKYNSEVFRGIISAALIGFCNVLRKLTDDATTIPKQNVSLFNRFLELLQTTEAKHNTVDYYAQQLCISSKYLSVICKKNSGKTANEWIQEYTLSAITHYLRDTNLSVKEISNRLGFPNTSFFGKYVREHLGATPVAFRRQQNR
jgi:AraC family transcriptional activator of pobA